MADVQNTFRVFNTAWFYIRTPIKAGNYYCRAAYLNDPSYNKTETNNAFKGYCTLFSPWHDLFTNSDNVRIVNFVNRVLDVTTSYLPTKLFGFLTNTATSVSVSKWEKDRDQHLLKIKQLDDSCKNTTKIEIVDLLNNEAGYSYSPFWIIGPEIVASTVSAASAIIVASTIRETSAISALISSNSFLFNFVYSAVFAIPRYMQLTAENKRFVESRSKAIAKIAEECTEGVEFLRENFDCDRVFDNTAEMLDEIFLGNCQPTTTELSGEELVKTEL